MELIIIANLDPFLLSAEQINCIKNVFDYGSLI